MDEATSLSHGELVQLVVELRAELSLCLGRMAGLEAENARLRGEVKRLESRAASLPGGKEPPPPFVRANKPTEPEGEPKPRKKRTENHARKREAPTEEVVHALDNCPKCGRALSGGWVHARRQVIDVPVQRYVVREHALVRRYCGVCRKYYVPKLDLSGEVVGKRRFGIRLMAEVAYLRTECRQPVGSIQGYLLAKHELSISEGEIVGLAQAVADAGRSTYEALREEIRSSPVVHADETGSREDGIAGFLWGFFTETVRFLLRDRSRGSAVPMDALGADFRGKLVADFYSGYSPLACVKQRCWVHFLRDLKALEEAYPEDGSVAQWRAAIRSLYGEAVEYREEQLALGSDVPMRVLRARRRVRAGFERELLKLSRRVLRRKRPDPRRVLAERIRRFIKELFVFLEYPEVPPENNLAERALRPAVVARKVSGGTRSPRGSETMAILYSLFGTWRVRGLKPMECCVGLLAAAHA